MLTVAVLNQKGGVGKTTTAINLGAYLAKAGMRVLICDFDPQGNATSGVGMDIRQLEHGVYDVVVRGEATKDVLQHTYIDGLDIVPGGQDLAAAEVELANEMARELRLRAALEGLDYDICLIDCPPSLGLLTINALSAADHVLIPVQSEYYALEGLAQLTSVIQKVRETLQPNLTIIGILLTMSDSRTSLADQVEKEVRHHFGDLVFRTKIPRNVRLAEAPSYGKAIHDHDKWSKGAKAYKAAAKELKHRVEQK